MKKPPQQDRSHMHSFTMRMPHGLHRKIMTHANEGLTPLILRLLGEWLKRVMPPGENP